VAAICVCLILQCEISFQSSTLVYKQKESLFTHFAFVVIGFVLPLVPILTVIMAAIVEYLQSSSVTSTNLVSTGLGFNKGYSPTICFISGVTDFRIVLYSYVLLYLAILGVGGSFMILIFYHLCKVETITSFLKTSNGGGNLADFV